MYYVREKGLSNAERYDNEDRMGEYSRDLILNTPL